MSILTKSNFRKNKGTSVGLLLLMIITAMLIGLACLIFFDACPAAEKDGKRLDAGDGVIMIRGNTEGITDSVIEDVLSDDVEKYERADMLYNGETSMDYGEGSVVNELYINDSREFDKELNRSEIVTEDTSITENYVYLPNQFNASGGYHIGDMYRLELSGKEYNYKIRGFFDTTYFGCNNTGDFEFVVDDESYRELAEVFGDNGKASVVCFFLKENVKASKFKISVINRLLAVDAGLKAGVELFDIETTGKTFMALILAVAFLVMTMILVIVIMLMVKSSITNYIRENMRTIGALKSIGYTSGKIRRSMYAMFGIMAIIAGIVGTSLSYVIMPMMAQMVTGQSGVPYHTSFTPAATIVSVAAVVLFVLFVCIVSSRKIRKIEAIEALRDGQKSHNFTRNHVRLDKSIFGLNTSLAFKTTIRNIKQNLITFFVTGLLVFGCVIGLQIYENYNVHPSINYFSSVVADVAVSTDAETQDEIYRYLTDYDGTKNVQRVHMVSVFYKDEDRLFSYSIDDMEKMNNKDCCYEGEIPKYDNEIAVSGKFASDYGFHVGDEIEMNYAGNKYNYLITGLIQSTSNSGREALFSEAGMSNLLDLENATVYFYFDMQDLGEVDRVLDDCVDRYGEHIKTTANFQKLMDGIMITFKGISSVMMIMMSVIAGAVILLVLFLMVRTLIYNKRRDYGIYKAIGFTSGKLILQTAISFMPTIVLSVIVFSAVSYFAANPYMSMMMRTFGMMKCDFPIPITGIVIIGASMALLAFIFAIWMSRRIRKIEAYQMLVGE